MNIKTLERLSKTDTFRRGGVDRWRRARLGVIGCGNLGSRFATEAVRSGAAVWLCDPGEGEIVNTGTQLVRAGIPKVQSIIDACDKIRIGSASGCIGDILHVGPGVLAACDVLIDATDDPALAFPLTQTANGLGKPLLRLALDGTGKREFGRVLCSDGGNGGACQVCSKSLADLWSGTTRTPCPGNGRARPPTLAGGALGMCVAGTGLLQAQRLVTQNELAQVLDREVLLAWDHMQAQSISLPRCEDCISGHSRWDLTELPQAAVPRLADLFDTVCRRLDSLDCVLEPYQHPLALEVDCDCGAEQRAVGTSWATPPDCVACGAAMRWRAETQRASLTREHAETLGIMERSLESLGFPNAGALFIARSPNRPSLPVLLTGEAS